MNFEIDILNIKNAGSEKSVSKTIEELLELNKKIPARTNEEVKAITEKQFESNKDSRGEKPGTLEMQLNDTDNRDDEFVLLENRLDNSDTDDSGRNPKAWDTDDEKARGHKNVPPIWLEVYRKEDKRKGEK